MVLDTVTLMGYTQTNKGYPAAPIEAYYTVSSKNLLRTQAGWPLIPSFQGHTSYTYPV